MYTEKDFYLCHPLRGLSRMVSHSDQEVRKRKEKAGKYFHKYFGVLKKISTFAVPSETKEKTRSKQAQSHVEIKAETRVEARSSLKK
ncbi:hypothetical protein ACR78G_04205 [Sphingobacterium spiritivorum]|uniref:hypothetical protein n=1 Tax=Sphingobacterium spiritivorum TaxID=258 RepID=UPI003DA66B1F